MRFRSSQHLRHSSTFLHLREKGKMADCGTFVMRVGLREGLKGEGALPRLGVVASRRVGGAVQRNRAKRLMRELFRQHQAHLPAEADVLLIARKQLLSGSFENLRARYLRGLQQCLSQR